MKKSFIQLLLLSVIAFTLPLSVASAADSGEPQSIDLKQNIITVEDLSAEYHSESGTITVTGQIRNVSRSFLKGFATIYLLSSEGQEIFSYQEDVNGGESFAHGATVDFEASARVGDVSKVASISVDFTQD